MDVPRAASSETHEGVLYRRDGETENLAHIDICIYMSLYNILYMMYVYGHAEAPPPLLTAPSWSL